MQQNGLERRSQMYRVAAFLLLAVVAFSFPAPAAPKPEPIRIVWLFVLNAPNENAKNGVVSWAQAFKNNVSSLLTEASAGLGAKNYIKVSVNREFVDDIDRDGLEEKFTKSSSLQSLATVATFDGKSTFVDIDIYVGNLKGKLNEPFLHLSQEVVTGRYQISREALAVITLYTYAMAIAEILPPEINRLGVCQVLERAYQYNRNQLDAIARKDLEPLFTAISSDLAARACGGKK